MNRIAFVNQFCDIETEVTSDVYFIEIDGNTILSKDKLFLELQKKFQLPDVNGWDAIRDWLGDLGWLNKEGYILAIKNFNQLLSDDQVSKDMFLEVLADTVEWWNGDVEKYVVQGKKKRFDVYILD